MKKATDPITDAELNDNCFFELIVRLSSDHSEDDRAFSEAGALEWLNDYNFGADAPFVEDGKVYPCAEVLFTYIDKDGSGLTSVGVADKTARGNKRTEKLTKGMRTYLRELMAEEVAPLETPAAPVVPTVETAGTEASRKAEAVRNGGISPAQRTQNHALGAVVYSINGEDANVFLRKNGVKEYARIEGEEYGPEYGGVARGVFAYNGQLYRVYMRSVHLLEPVAPGSFGEALAAPPAVVPTPATPAEVAVDKQVYVLTYKETGEVLVYGSAAAMLADQDNELSIDRNQLNYKARAGFPIEFDGLIIHRTELRRKVKPV